jgi:type II secretory pathway pseudopilin PulG
VKLHKFKGFTLVEVIIGFVLLSFIIAMVSVVITSMYTLSSKLDELPNAYYGAQDQAERGLDELSSYVKQKYRLQNEINNTAPGDLDPSLYGKLADVNSKLAAYSKESFTLFGKNIDIYKFDVDYTSASNQNLTLHAGVVNAETLDRLVPIIDSVTIKKAGAGVSNELYYGAGERAEVSSVAYNSKNSSYQFKELYQWYICTGNFHTALYADGAHFEDEPQYGNTIYTAYPNHFTLLAGETKSSIQIKSSYYGQMLVCVVTPLSRNGAMGESVVSNYLYISALPRLNSGTYRMLIDASMTTYAYEGGGTVDLPSIQSRIPSGCSLVSSSGIKPMVDLNGAATDTDILNSATGEGTYSRYISFSDSTAMRTNSFSSAGETIVFAVVKNNEFGDVDFISAGGMSAGLTTNSRKTSGSGDTGWQLVEAVLPDSCGSFEVGRCHVDVAELIVVSEASSSERNDIWNYLSQKYCIG